MYGKYLAGTVEDRFRESMISLVCVQIMRCPLAVVADVVMYSSTRPCLPDR